MKNLLAAGGDVPLRTATAENSAEGIQLLPNTPTTHLNRTDNCGSTPLHDAADRGNQQSLSRLLAQTPAPDVNIVNKENKSPLQLAIEKGYTKCMQLLVRHGAGDKMNEHGDTALHYCARENAASFLSVLLKMDPTPEFSVRNDAMETALHVATRNNSPDILSAILTCKLSPDIDIADINNDTPLHIAARNGYLKCVKLLFNRGAACNVEGIKELALKNGLPDIIKAIFDDSIQPEGQHLYGFDYYHLLEKNTAGLLEMAFLYKMSRSKDFDNTLHHALVTSVVMLKQCKTRLLCILLTVLTILTILYFALGFHVLNSYTMCLFTLNLTASNITLDGVELCYSTEWHHNLWPIWFICVCFSFMYEVIQVSILGPAYFRSMENLLDLHFIMCCCICYPGFSHLHNLQQFVGILGMILYSMNLMIYIFKGNLYVMMFRNALCDAFQLLIPYSILILGFCFVYKCIYAGLAGFEKPEYSLVQILIMMMGNLDFIPEQLNQSSSSDFTIVAALIAFIMLLMIIMVNMLVSLTIDGSSEVKLTSKTEILKNKIAQLYNLEQLFRLVPTARMRKRYSLNPTISVSNSKYDADFSKRRADRSVKGRISYRLAQGVAYVIFNLGWWHGKVYEFQLNFSKIEMMNIEETVRRKRKTEETQRKEKIIHERRFLKTVITETTNKNNADIIEKIHQHSSEQILDFRSEVCSKINKLSEDVTKKMNKVSADMTEKMNKVSADMTEKINKQTEQMNIEMYELTNKVNAMMIMLPIEKALKGVFFPALVCM